MSRKRLKYRSREEQKAAFANMDKSGKKYGRYSYPKYVGQYRKTIIDKYPQPEIESPLEEIISLEEVVERIKNKPEEVIEEIKNHPKIVKQILGRIALWGGCTLAPSICPILESVYLIYKGCKTVFKINELDIQSGDFKLFQTIFNGDLTKEKVKDISPQTINMLARKAEYVHHIMSELQEMGIPPEKEIIIKNSLLSASLKIDYKGLLTDNELSEHSLKITPSVIVNKKRLLNSFSNTLRDNEPSLYKELLLQIVKHVTDELF